MRIKKLSGTVRLVLTHLALKQFSLRYYDDQKVPKSDRQIPGRYTDCLHALRGLKQFNRFRFINSLTKLPD